MYALFVYQKAKGFTDYWMAFTKWFLGTCYFVTVCAFSACLTFVFYRLGRDISLAASPAELEEGIAGVLEDVFFPASPPRPPPRAPLNC